MLISVLVLCVACTGLAGRDGQANTDHLLAEYSMMKKRLPLIERENDVLKQENRQYRTEIWDQRNKIEKLGEKLASVSENYAKDKAAAGEQIQNLHRDMENIQKEHALKIEALTSMNNAVKEDLTRKVEVLHKQNEEQKSAFSQERKQIVQQNAQSEFKLTSRINELNKTIEAKVLEVSSLKIALSEISTRLGEATARAEALRKARDEYVTELQAAKETNTEIQRKMSAMKATSAQLQARTDAMKETNSRLQTQMDEEKESNTRLQTKMDAMKATISQLQAKMDEEKESNVRLQTKMDAMKATINQLQAKIDEEKESNARLQKKNDPLSHNSLKPSSPSETKN
jgi:predicted nuclease with TOPRIM domain